MSPIDHELRQSLHRHADALPAAPDLFTVVERRARRIRRNRIGASVAGAAVAVSAIAVIAPNVLPHRDNRGSTPGIASTVSQPPANVAAYDLDPASPWAYRGERAVLANGTLDAFRRDWTAKHPGSQLQPLFGQLYEPSQTPEVVFVAQVGDSARWGVVTATGSGPDFVIDEPLPPDTRTLVAALPGDEVARLLVVAAPAITAIRYAPDGVTYRTMAKLADGVATTPLDGTKAHDTYQTFGAGGESVDRGVAPDGSATAQATHNAAQPANLLPWPTRGAAATGLVTAALDAYLASQPTARVQPGVHVLYAGVDPAGTQYLLAQVWQTTGQLADTVGFVKHQDGTTELQLKSRIAAGATVVAMDVVDSPAGSTETLVVVPQPAFGQALYAADGSHFAPVTSDQDGIVVIQRDPRASSDTVRLLDGDGKTFFEGAIFTLLCGATSCG